MSKVRLTDDLMVEVYNESLGWHSAGSIPEVISNWPQLAETINQLITAKESKPTKKVVK